MGLNNNVVPASCISLKEQSKYISNKILENYNEFISNIGNKEFESFKEGIAIDESEYLKESIKDLHLKNLETIAEAYGIIRNKFESILESMDELYIQPANESYGKIHEFVNIDKVDFSNNYSNYLAALSNIYDYAIENNMTPDYIEGEVISEFEANMCDSISGIKSITINEMNDNLKKDLNGNFVEVNENYLDKNCEYMNNIIGSDYILNKIDESFENEYNAIMEFVDNIDSMSEEYNDYMGQWNKLICMAESVMTNCYLDRFDAYNRMINEYRNIAIKTSYLNEYSIIRSRRSKLSYAKKKKLGAKYDFFKMMKERLKHKKK